MLPPNNSLSLLNDIFILFFVFLTLFSFKGFMQALLAKIMGDNTGKDEGFLSLNPLAHIDIFGLGTVLFVYFVIAFIFSESIPRGILFIILVAFGAHMIKPVPIAEGNFKHHVLGGILTALAGPIANFLLAMLSILGLRLLILAQFPQYIFISILGVLHSIINIAILFGIIDLIPLPPFDGGKILRYVIPDSWQNGLDWLEDYSFVILIILFFAPVVSDGFFSVISTLSQIIKQLMFGLLT
jgi:Zn-dependent protease